MREPSVTRAPMVPAVTLGCPVLTPMGTGRGKFFLGSTASASAGVGMSPRARKGPVTSVSTSTPTMYWGKPATAAIEVT